MLQTSTNYAMIIMLNRITRRCTMQAFEIIGGILLILMAIAIIIMVLMQEGKGGGASALGGAQPQSYGKNRAKTLDVLLSKYTKVIGAAFLVVTFLVWILSIYF